jgi:hypothetical protein
MAIKAGYEFLLEFSGRKSIQPGGAATPGLAIPLRILLSPEQSHAPQAEVVRTGTKGDWAET